jgi:hypothetical protein
MNTGEHGFGAAEILIVNSRITSHTAQISVSDFCLQIRFFELR